MGKGGEGYYWDLIVPFTNTFLARTEHSKKGNYVLITK